MQIELALRKLRHFVKLCWPILNPLVPYEENWHIAAICEHLEALTALEIQKLIINLPPRHTKSFICSVFWPVWVWLQDPSSQWVFASYAQDLAERDSDRCRNLLKNKLFQGLFRPGWKISETHDRVDSFRNTVGGSRKTTTPEGEGTGLDSDYFVLDDPHNAQDKRYPGRLQKVVDFCDHVVASRGNNPATFRRLITHQMISTGDVSNVMSKRDQGWECLILPGRYEPNRVVYSFSEAREKKIAHPIVINSVQKNPKRPHAIDPRRDDGELLWANRWNDKALGKLEAELNVQAPAQIQQRPSAEDGSIFQKQTFRNYYLGIKDGQPAVILLEPEDKARWYPLDSCRCFQTADTAQKPKQANDYTAVGTFLLTPDADLLVHDFFRAKLTIPHQFPALVAARRGPIRWLPESQKFQRLGSWERVPLFQAVEDKASGIGLIQQGAMIGHPFKVIEADRGKEERASPVSTLYFLGKVYHNMRGTWLGDFESELVAFPGGNHDDMVDCVAYAGYLVQHDVILRQYLQGELITDTDQAADFDISTVITSTGEVIKIAWDD